MPDITQLYVSISGSDTNAGTEPDAPLRTIMAASSAATPGCMVLIEPGLYDEQLINLTGGSSFHNHVIYQAADPNQRPLIKPSSGNRPLFLSTSHLTIRGLAFDGSNCRYDCAKITRQSGNAATDVQLIGCAIRNGFENGVLISGKPEGVKNILISGCIIHGNGRAGTRFFHGIYNAVDRVVITECEIFDNAGWGIHSYEPSVNPSWVTIINNHVHYNGHGDPLKSAAGIGVYFGYEIELSNNNVHDNPRSVVFNTGIGGPP
jgi:hypothetical protein